LSPSPSAMVRLVKVVPPSVEIPRPAPIPLPIEPPTLAAYTVSPTAYTSATEQTRESEDVGPAGLAVPPVTAFGGVDLAGEPDADEVPARVLDVDAVFDADPHPATTIPNATAAIAANQARRLRFTVVSLYADTNHRR